MKGKKADVIPLAVQPRPETEVPKLLKGTEFEELMKKFRELEQEQKHLEEALEKRKDTKKPAPKKAVPKKPEPAAN